MRSIVLSSMCLLLLSASAVNVPTTHSVYVSRDWGQPKVLPIVGQDEDGRIRLASTNDWPTKYPNPQYLIEPVFPTAALGMHEQQYYIKSATNGTKIEGVWGPSEQTRFYIHEHSDEYNYKWVRFMPSGHVDELCLFASTEGDFMNYNGSVADCNDTYRQSDFNFVFELPEEQIESVDLDFDF